MLLEALQNPHVNSCVGISFLIKLQASPAERETQAQVFTSEFWEVFS